MEDKIVYLNQNSQNNEKKSIIALGNFDGLHKGHMELINKVVDESLLNDYNSMVYTFTNHPLTVAAPEKAPKIIMDLEQKLHILKNSGVDMVALVDFTWEYMQTSAEDFIKLLLEKYNAAGFVVGFNYRFGYQNTGNVEMLKELQQKYKFALYIVEAKSDEDGIISSTRIRELISDGKISQANSLLLEPFMLRGTIVEGKKNGRKLGFPTANLKVDEKMIIPHIGVYYTNVKHQGKVYKGITSVGYNPTISEGNPLTIETYILNFNEEIYGDEIELYFIEWMRNEVKYDSVDDLIRQLTLDNNNAMLFDMVIEEGNN